MGAGCVGAQERRTAARTRQQRRVQCSAGAGQDDVHGMSRDSVVWHGMGCSASSRTAIDDASDLPSACGSPIERADLLESRVPRKHAWQALRDGCIFSAPPSPAILAGCSGREAENECSSL